MVSANKKLFADAISANKKLFAASGVLIEKKHVMGGGLLYGGLFYTPPFILFLTCPPCTVSVATTSDSEVNL